jgi:hypothetical protein
MRAALISSLGAAVDEGDNQAMEAGTHFLRFPQLPTALWLDSYHAQS